MPRDRKYTSRAHMLGYLNAGAHSKGVTHVKRTLLNPIPHDGILEYLSRPARRKITKTLCQKLVDNNEQLFEYQSLVRKRGRPDYRGMSLLAARWGISRKTVSKWINQEMQGSNENVQACKGTDSSRTA